MLYCNECGQSFEEEGLSYELTGVHHLGVWQREAACPHCGGDDFEEAALCKYCGAWVPQSGMHVDMEDMCLGCYEGERKAMSKEVEAQGSALRQAVWAYINEVA